MTVDFFETLKDTEDNDLYIYASTAEYLYSLGLFIAVPIITRFWLEGTLKRICDYNNIDYVKDKKNRLLVQETKELILQFYKGEPFLKKYLDKCQGAANKGSHNKVEIAFEDKPIFDDAQIALKAMYNLYKWYCYEFYPPKILPEEYCYPKIVDIEATILENAKLQDEILYLNDVIANKNIVLSNTDKPLKKLDIWEIKHENARLLACKKELEGKVANLEKELRDSNPSMIKIMKVSEEEKIIQLEKQISNLQSETKEYLTDIDKLKDELTQQQIKNQKIYNNFEQYKKEHSSVTNVDAIRVRMLEEKNIKLSNELVRLKNLCNRQSNKTNTNDKKIYNELEKIQNEYMEKESKLNLKLNAANLAIKKFKEEIEKLDFEKIQIIKSYATTENELRTQLQKANEQIQQLQQNKNEYGIDNKVIAKNGAEKLQLAYENASKDKDIKMHLYDDVLTTIRMMTKRKSNIYITRNTIKIFLTGDTSANQVKYFQLDKLDGFGKYQDKYIEAIDIENILYYLEDGEILQNNDGFYKLLVN